MRMVYVIMLAIIAAATINSLCGCDTKQTPEQKAALTEQYRMKCTDDLAPGLGYTMYRCENEEAVCYGYGGKGDSCHFKNK